LKLSTYHKLKGDRTEFINFKNKDQRGPKKTPKKIYITSLFTWTWKPVWNAVAYYKNEFPKAEIWLGGVYASLMPEHAKMSRADHIFKGIFTDAENVMPDYDLVPDWDGSIVFHRGVVVITVTFVQCLALKGK